MQVDDYEALRYGIEEDFNKKTLLYVNIRDKTGGKDILAHQMTYM